MGPCPECKHVQRTPHSQRDAAPGPAGASGAWRGGSQTLGSWASLATNCYLGFQVFRRVCSHTRYTWWSQVLFLPPPEPPPQSQGEAWGR